MPFPIVTAEEKAARRASPELFVPTIKRVDGVLVKECTLCHEVKTLNKDNFYKKNTTYGFASGCRICKNGKDKEYLSSTKGMATKQESRKKYQDSGRATEMGVKWSRSKRMQVFQHYSGGLIPECACCGENQFEFLAVDHINGGGTKLLRECGETPSVLIKSGFPEGRQILCHCCNSSKGYWGECAHKPWKEEITTRTIASNCHGRLISFNCGPSRADYTRARQRAMRAYVVAHYSQHTNQCACCGESNYRFLCLDHIHGGGNIHRKEMGDAHPADWIFNNNFPPIFRVLCFNCNMADGIYGYCPHANKHKLQVVTEVQGVCINAQS